MASYSTMSDGSDEWKELYALIGEIVVVSNTAHWCVFEMMGILLNTSREDTTPIYYSLKADSAQRDLTLAIAQDRLSIEFGEAPLLERLTKAINALGTLSGKRNAFVHSHWSMDHYGKGQRKLSVEGKPHPKLDLENPIGQGKQVLKDLDAHIDVLIRLCDELEETPSVLRLQERTGGRRR